MDIEIETERERDRDRDRDKDRTRDRDRKDRSNYNDKYRSRGSSSSDSMRRSRLNGKNLNDRTVLIWKIVMTAIIGHKIFDPAIITLFFFVVIFVYHTTMTMLNCNLNIDQVRSILFCHYYCKKLTFR